MKRKLIVLFLMAAMLPAMVFASSDILQLGINVGYKPTLDSLISEPKTDWKSYVKTEYFTFAPEMKVNLLFVDIDATAYFNFSEIGMLIDTQVGADLFVKLFDTLRLSAGAGVNIPLFYSKGDSAWYIDGTPLSGTSFIDTMKRSNLAYRAGIGVNFGLLDLMLNYSVPTAGNFKTPDFKPNWRHGQFSAGLLVNLF